jgi:uncharacterized protein YkwD
MLRDQLCMLMLTLLCGSAMAADPKAKKPEPFKLSDVEKAVLDATNAERKEKKLEPLVMNPTLVATARAHAANMAKQNKLAHELDEKGVDSRVKDAGYRFRRVGENVAWNQKTPAQVLASWMDSEGHRKNILNAEFTEMGMAAVANSQGEIYWCQVFGTPAR